MEQLINSAVLFNEENHTYTLNDKPLSGITSIISRYIFPDMYSGVSAIILQQAQDRGKRVHNNIQMYLSGMPYDESDPEMQAFLAAVKEKPDFQFLASEYIVSDEQSVASAIDIVAKQFEGYMLFDIKTTAYLNMEYLQWQLSIYAYLFERQTNERVTRLCAIHLREDKCEFVEVQRLPDEYVIALLDAYRSGAEQFDNPLHQMPDDFEDMLTQYAETKAVLAEIEATAKPYEEQKKRLEEAIAERLREKGLTKLETDRAKITVGADSQRQSFDLKSFCKSDIYAKSAEMYDEFIKSTTVKGRVTITLR